MKTIKIILITFMVAITLLIPLGGCNGETESLSYDDQFNNNKENDILLNERNIGTNDIDNNQITSSNISFNSSVAAGMSSIPLGVINISDGINLKNELVEHMNIAKTPITSRIMNQEAVQGTDAELQDYYNQAYLANDISNITEFYFPIVEIDGYELYRVLIDEWSFMYYYAPVEELRNKKESEYIFTFETGILIGVNRPHWVDTDDPLNPEIENRKIQNIEFVLKDNLLYTQSQNNIMGQIGNTNFSIIVPNELNNFDFLYELGLKIIETSELVVVGK